MGHIAAVTQLDTDFGTLCMYGIGQTLQTGKYLIVNIQLTIKTHTAPVHRTICHSRHSYTAPSYTHVVILKHLRRTVVPAHVLKRG